jgi:hypothetical protein
MVALDARARRSARCSAAAARLPAEQPEERGRQLDAAELAGGERRAARVARIERRAVVVERARAFDFARREADRQRVAELDALRDDVALPPRARRIGRLPREQPSSTRTAWKNSSGAARRAARRLRQDRFAGSGLASMISSPVRFDTTTS